MVRPDKLFNTDVTISGVITTVSGAFTNLTVSGIPVDIDGGGGGGSGTITDINTVATGPSVTITGVGGVNTITEGNTITISGGQFSPGFKGVLLAVSSGTTFTTATTSPLAWDTVSYDTDGFFDFVGDPQRITIPAGINRVQFSAQVHWDTSTVGDRRLIMRKNDLAQVDNDPENGQVMFHWDPSSTLTSTLDNYMQGVTPVMQVEEGDYFRLYGRQGTGGDLDIESGGTWLQMQVLDPLPAPGPNLTGKQAFRGAHITTSSGVDVPHNESIRMVFDSAVFDTDGFYNGVNGFVIPAGITKIMVHTLINWDDNISTYENTIFQLSIRRIRDGVDAFQTITRQIGVSVNSSNGRIETVQESHAALIEVQEGDIIELDVFQRDLAAGTSAVVTRPIGDRAGMTLEVLEDNEPITFNEFVATSGTFTDSLTVSGIPVQLEGGGGGASTLQDAYDGGDGTIATTGGKPLELTGTGELTAVTGTFTDGLTVGGASTFIDGGSITTATGTFDDMTIGGLDVSATNVQGDITTSGVISRKLGLEHNPIGLWLFDGSLEDSSGNGFDFTVGGGSERYVSTNGLRAAKLDGSTSFIHNVTGTVLERTGDITIEVLLTVDPGSSQRWIVAYSASGETEAVNALYSINYLGSTEQLNWVSEGVSASDDNFNSEAAGIDHLHLLAVVRESDVITVYIDGSQVGASSATLDTPVGGTSSVLEVGSLFLTGGTFLEGSVACVKIIDSALTADEVYTEFERTWGVSEGVNLTLADAITVSSGTFTQSLTLSGTPVATQDDLQAATEQISISGTSLSYFVPDAPPASGTTVNDEFDQNPFQETDAGLDVPIDSKWTVFDPDGAIDGTNNLHGVYADGFHLRTSTPSNNDTVVAYIQDIPAGNSWQFVVKVGISPAAIGNGVRIGLILGDDTMTSSPTTADLATVSLRYSLTTEFELAYEEWTDFDSPVTTNEFRDVRDATLTASQDTIALQDGVYLKIGWRASDNRIDTGYSFNGFAFKDLRSNLTTHPFSGEPTKIGIFMSVSTNDTPTGHFQFFRMNDHNNFLRDNPVYGRRIAVSGTVNSLGGGGVDTSADETITGAWDFSNSLTVSGVPVAPSTSLRGAKVSLIEGGITVDTADTVTLSWAVANDQLDYDTDGFLTASGADRFTVPSDVTKVRVTGQMIWGNNSVGSRAGQIRSGDPANNFSGAAFTNTAALVNTAINLACPIVTVTGGQEFTMSALNHDGQGGDGSGDTQTVLHNGQTWFSIEVIE